MNRQERLEKNKSELQQHWDNLSQKITVLRNRLAFETRPEEKLRLQALITEAIDDRENVARKLDELEERLKVFAKVGIDNAETKNIHQESHVLESTKTATEPDIIEPEPIESSLELNKSEQTQPTGFAYDVFISYSQADRTWVQTELLPHLDPAGLRVCIDFRDFITGAPRPTEVERAVLTSHKTLLILTPSYLESEWDEFGNLMLQTLDPASRQRRLIPLRKAPCDLPLRLQFLWPVDFVEPADWDIAWTQLLTALRAPST